MTYSRVVNRNGLQGDYENERANSLIAGDLRGFLTWTRCRDCGVGDREAGA